MESIDENFTKGEESFGISEISKKNLLETARWAQFLAVVGFIGLGLMLIGGLFLVTNGDEMATMPFERRGGFSFENVGFIYLIMAMIFLVPVYHLFKFATSTKAAFASSITFGLDEATTYLKAHYKFNGIVTIIVLSIYGLVILLGVLGTIYR